MFIGDPNPMTPRCEQIIEELCNHFPLVVGLSRDDQLKWIKTLVQEVYDEGYEEGYHDAY